MNSKKFRELQHRNANARDCHADDCLNVSVQQLHAPTTIIHLWAQQILII
jgi:hypothetical protein